MSRTYRGQERRIRVYGLKREHPDLRRFSRALIDLVRLEAEASGNAGRTDSPASTKKKASDSRSRSTRGEGR